MKNHDNIDPNELKKASEQGQLEQYLSSHLSSGTKVKLNHILSDRTKTEQLLSTPQAKELLKKLGRGK